MTGHAPDPVPTRDAAHWATPVDRLSASGVSGAPVDSFTGEPGTGAMSSSATSPGAMPASGA